MWVMCRVLESRSSDLNDFTSAVSSHVTNIQLQVAYGEATVKGDKGKPEPARQKSVGHMPMPQFDSIPQEEVMLLLVRPGQRTV